MLIGGARVSAGDKTHNLRRDTLRLTLAGCEKVRENRMGVQRQPSWKPASA